MIAEVDQATLAAIVVVTIAAIIAATLLIVRLHRRFIAAAERAQMRVFEGTNVSLKPGPGLVEVVFHTYCGLLAFTHQTEHRFWASPEDAQKVLSQLHRFNLTWGFFAYGALFIPLLSLGNYLAQRSQIKKQAAAVIA